MYDAELWQKAFPNLFPYGDGVFGLKKRKTPMTFSQWAFMMMKRTELVYDVPASSRQECENCPLTQKTCDPHHEHYYEPCAQCQHAEQHYLPPAQPRWSTDLTFMCAVYDTKRRMDFAHSDP